MEVRARNFLDFVVVGKGFGKETARSNRQQGACPLRMVSVFLLIDFFLCQTVIFVLYLTTLHSSNFIPRRQQAGFGVDVEFFIV